MKPALQWVIAACVVGLVVWFVEIYFEPEPTQSAPVVTTPPSQPVKVAAPAKAEVKTDADEIVYDPAEKIRKERLVNVTNQTRGCAREAVRSMLRLGSRSREQIIGFTLQTCGGVLRIPQLGLTKEQATVLADKIANEELDTALK